MRIAFVADSTADIPAELTAEYHIYIVPTILVINGQSIEDGKGITRNEFYQKLPSLKTTPTTASPASGVYKELYQRLLDDGYEHIVSTHLSTALSGLQNSAVLAAEKFNGHVHILDSKQLSMGIGFQVLVAAEAAKQGASIEEVFAAVDDVRRRIRVMAMLDTLEYVRRSGRISWAEASLGQVLQLKSFISLREGIPIRQGETRTRRKGIQRLYQFITRLGPLERLAILHSSADSDARELAAKLTSQSSQPPFVIQVTPVIGTHVGPNALGFAAVVR